jgi:hypothetical protein
MPYLMLDFEAVKASTKKGKDHIKLRMINTDTGKVIEISGDLANAEHVERAPVWSETHTADQVLGHKIDGLVDESRLKQLEAERDSYRQKAVSAESSLRRKDENIAYLNGKLDEFRRRDLDDQSRARLAAALDVHIEELALSGNLEAYQKAKKLYKSLTGKAWVDEGSDDDEEDDLGDLQGGFVFWNDAANSNPREDIEKFVESMLSVHNEFSGHVFAVSKEMYRFFARLYCLEPRIEEADDRLHRFIRTLDQRKAKKMPDHFEKKRRLQQQRRLNKMPLPGR